MLVFAVEQSESTMCLHISPPSGASPPPPPHPSRSSQNAQDPSSSFLLAVCFTRGSVSVSVLLSQFISPCPPPGLHVCSLPRGLYPCPAHRYFCVIFLESVIQRGSQSENETWFLMKPPDDLQLLATSAVGNLWHVHTLGWGPTGCVWPRELTSHPSAQPSAASFYCPPTMCWALCWVLSPPSASCWVGPPSWGADTGPANGLASSASPPRLLCCPLCPQSTVGMDLTVPIFLFPLLIVEQW